MKVIKYIEQMPIKGREHVPVMPKLGIGTIVEYMGRICTIQHRHQSYNGKAWRYTLLSPGLPLTYVHEWCN